MNTHFILYVADQARSAAFYAAVLGCAPSLDVPGMTEFALSAESVLGLMPESGIRSLLRLAPAERTSPETLRAELYLVVPSPETYLERALEVGARKLSGLEHRDWGDIVAYCLDLDGYVLAFARRGAASG